MNNFFESEWQGDSDKPMYTKLEKGDTKIRIVSRALIGWEGWYQNKPVRFKSDYKITPDEYATLDKDNFDSSKSKYKQFAVCVVWNYDHQCPQIWQFSQRQIRDQLMQLGSDSDWGDVTGYDIKVKREGEKMETKYTLTPSNKAPLSDQIRSEILERGLEPEQVFTDKKNIENIENLRNSIPVSMDKEREDAKDIPF